ncbi:hypothetical protein Tco_0158783 [Tanacetum coccineum]
MRVKYPNYVNLTSSSEEQPNERTPSPPSRKKSLSPSQAPSKLISSKSTHYTSSSSPSESLTPTHVVPPPKLRFVIPIKLEPQELPPLQVSANDPYVQTMDNWPTGHSNPSPPPCVSRLPPNFPNPSPEFELLPSTQPLCEGANSKRIKEFEVRQNKKRCREDLDILEERREITSTGEAYYKHKLEGYYNKRVQPSTFKPGTYVLRINSASKAEFQGKMGPT